MQRAEDESMCDNVRLIARNERKSTSEAQEYDCQFAMTNSTTQKVVKNATWWKRRSDLERKLAIISISGFLLCIALAMVLTISATNMSHNTLRYSKTSKGFNTVHKSPECNDICLTPGCIRTASEILKKMDPDVEPCDDFYKFACGKFIENNDIRADDTSVNPYSVSYDTIYKQMRIIIEQESPPNEPKPFTLVKNFYKACMNTTKIEEVGLQPLLDLLRKLGGWPVLDGERWNDGHITWKDTVYRYRKLGASVKYFFGLNIGIDAKNNSRRVITLDQPSLRLSREYLSKGFNDKFVQFYYSYMVDIAVILGANRDRAKKELKQSLEFEIALANITLPKEKLRNATKLYNPMTVNELSMAYPSIPWWEYIQTIFAPERLNRDEIIIVTVPSFLKDFEKLVDRTSERVLVNYMLWRVVAGWVIELTDDVRERQLKYHKQLYGRSEREPRWEECVGVMMGSLGISVSSMYVRKYFKQDAKKNALQMVNDIKQEFVKTLKKVDWMDEETRANALEKMHSMTSHIAYPDELLDDRKLEEYFSKLEMRSDDYAGSIMNLTIFYSNLGYSTLRKPVNKPEWILQPVATKVNTDYSAFQNSIQVPAGILQGAYFSNDQPRYINYGGIGSVIGHEITHCFDYPGSLYNKDGIRLDWWQPETREQYLDRFECIISQYGNYTMEDMKLNGPINIQGENIADNGGMKAAYFAYKEWVKRNGREQRLPGLSYTPEQMFWISTANTWCDNVRHEVNKIHIVSGSDPISPNSPKFRVLGPMSNIEAFARDFNCPVGSTMNPKKKCIIW